MLAGSIPLSSPTWWGFLHLQTSSKIVFWVTLGGAGDRDPSPQLLCFCMVPPSFPHPLPSLLLLLLSRSVVSDSVRPQRRQPTRLRRPWDSPGKNTGVGCQFLLQCMKVKSEREVAQSCPTLSDPMDCSPPDFSIHGIFQARVLEWGAIAFSASLP